MTTALTTALMTAMTTSISEVLETMFFLLAEPGDPVQISQLDSSKTICAKLSFSGDVSGALILAVPDTLLSEMAENFLGEPSDQLTQDHLNGTLTETVNMVCGNALRKVQTDHPFDLGIPEIIEFSALPEKETIQSILTPSAALSMILTFKS